MNKKIKYTSIIATGIIVLASITSVIGANSTESLSNESPLFAIRSYKATESKEASQTMVSYVNQEFKMSSLPIIENKLKYIFGMDITTEQIENIRNEVLDNPVYQQKIESGDLSYLLKEILDIINIDVEYNKPQPNTIPPTQCPTQSCGWDQCSCYDQALVVMGILVVFSAGLTVLIFIPMTFYFQIMTSAGKCDQLASVN